jgi:hypothetical protein
MSKGSISKKETPTPEKGRRNNEKEEEEVFGTQFHNFPRSTHTQNGTFL